MSHCCFAVQHCAEVVGNLLLVVGGYNPAQSITNPYADVWAFDLGEPFNGGDAIALTTLLFWPVREAWTKYECESLPSLRDARMVSVAESSTTEVQHWVVNDINTD